MSYGCSSPGRCTGMASSGYTFATSTVGVDAAGPLAIGSVGQRSPSSKPHEMQKTNVWASNRPDTTLIRPRAYPQRFGLTRLLAGRKRLGSPDEAHGDFIGLVLTSAKTPAARISRASQRLANNNRRLRAVREAPVRGAPSPSPRPWGLAGVIAMMVHGRRMRVGRRG